MTFDQKLRDILNRKELKGRALAFDELRQILDRLTEGFYGLHIPAFSSDQQALLRRIAIPRDKLRPLCAAYLLSFRQAPDVAKAIDLPDTLVQSLLDKDQQIARLQSLTSALLRVAKDHKLLLTYRLALTVAEVEATFQEMLDETQDEAARVRMLGAYGDLQQQSIAQTERLLTQRRNAERRGQADKAALAALSDDQSREARKQRLLDSSAAAEKPTIH